MKNNDQATLFNSFSHALGAGKIEEACRIAEEGKRMAQREKAIQDFQVEYDDFYTAIREAAEAGKWELVSQAMPTFKEAHRASLSIHNSSESEARAQLTSIRNTYIRLFS